MEELSFVLMLLSVLAMIFLDDGKANVVRTAVFLMLFFTGLYVYLLSQVV